MIVRAVETDLWLITQPDHASLAAQMMDGWQTEGLPGRSTRAAALFATAVHDVGWTDVDALPVVDPQTGLPIDFMNAPVTVKQDVWRHALTLLPARSTYATALVAQHALTIFRRYRGHPAWIAFFDEMERARDHWFTADPHDDDSSRRAIDPPADQRLTFLQDYATVRIGDVLSLAFCNLWTSLELVEGYAVVMAGSELTVTPDPFGGIRLPISVRARRIARRRYETDEDLRAALSAAPEEMLDGTAVGVAEPGDSISTATDK
jgi:hypothetical protein